MEEEVTYTGSSGQIHHTVTTKTYNADGTLSGFSQDSDGDGIDDFTFTMVYDVKAGIIESTTTVGGVSFYSTTVVTGDETAGTVAEDFDNDGQLDYATTHEYSAYQGEIWIDQGVDGVFESYLLITYDGEGRILTWHQDDWDDGIWDYVYINVYDGDGRLESRTTDLNGDGAFDRLEEWAWTCP